jgi:hypothetical protein
MYSAYLRISGTGFDVLETILTLKYLEKNFFTKRYVANSAPPPSGQKSLEKIAILGLKTSILLHSVT